VANILILVFIAIKRVQKLSSIAVDTRLELEALMLVADLYRLS